MRKVSRSVPAVLALVVTISGCGSDLGLDETRPDGTKGQGRFRVLGRVVELEFTWIAGRRMYGGDIELGLPLSIDSASDDDGVGWLRQASSSWPRRYLWPKSIIPYAFASGVSSTTKSRIQKAVQVWNNSKTKVTFVARTNEKDYVEVNPAAAGVCTSYVGRKGGSQPLNAGPDCEWYHLLHELGHSAGLMHEHQRVDRDKYIKVNLANALPDFVKWFDKDSPQLSHRRGAYDHASLMHYTSAAGAQPGKYVITRLDGSPIVKVPQALTKLDMEGVNAMYSNLGPDPLCKKGILNGAACCPPICGTCGGAGCANLPGGYDCCVGEITTRNEPCTAVGAPCLVIPGSCLAATDCDDGDACTTDSCVGNKCYHSKVSNCCTSGAQCDDGKPCTTDTCKANKCAYASRRSHRGGVEARLGASSVSKSVS